jgi:hypothetical protein
MDTESAQFIKNNVKRRFEEYQKIEAEDLKRAVEIYGPAPEQGEYKPLNHAFFKEFFSSCQQCTVEGVVIRDEVSIGLTDFDAVKVEDIPGCDVPCIIQTIMNMPTFCDGKWALIGSLKKFNDMSFTAAYRQNGVRKYCYLGIINRVSAMAPGLQYHFKVWA